MVVLVDLWIVRGNTGELVGCHVTAAKIGMSEVTLWADGQRWAWATSDRVTFQNAANTYLHAAQMKCRFESFFTVLSFARSSINKPEDPVSGGSRLTGENRYWNARRKISGTVISLDSVGQKLISMGGKANRGKSNPNKVSAASTANRTNKQYYVLRKDTDKSSLDDLSYNPGSKKGGRQSKWQKEEKLKTVVSIPVDNEWSPSPYSAFKLILSARFAAALWTSISDCDETYNYWEPTHYLLFGKGFQTWEYSPVYALRSYTYILIHAVPAKLYETLLKPNPLLVFFFLRCFLAFISAFTEVFLYKAIRNTFGGNVSRIALISSLFSAGMYISSSAYLPSAFSAYMTSLAIGAWLSNLDELAIFSVALSALLSWPFAALTGVFLALDIVFIRRQFLLFLQWSVISFLVILVPIVVIDSSYYGKMMIAPWNIVMYNIFSSKGPDLYGTEPWTYYFINGILNFNVMFIATLMAPVAVLFSLYANQNLKQKIVIISTVYLWLTVFILQPHKEERFLFPIYPLIPVCGAIAIDCSQKILDIVCSKIFLHVIRSMKKISASSIWDYRRLVSRVGLAAILISSLMGCSRILALHYGFRAPFDLYFHLHREASSGESPFLNVEKNLTICYGKEWHRFPASFLVPSLNWNVRFIQSEFRGQLPSLYPAFDPEGTKRIPQYMNDNNLEEKSRYISPEECDFMVDLIDLDRVTSREPNYSAQTDVWKVVSEHPFLNSAKSHPFFRAFYIPWISAEYTTYDRYVFLRNEKKMLQTNKPAPTKRNRQAGKEFLSDDLL
ncbi:unnamed protein product [Allacma fusca]|uniref:Mannosyltransferase n=1 Tax=Allacma fusca TaxID=39272 RepID=A0A8J2JGU8_9HEXA|nr:unnamed protein product [Allacma fusca]